MLITHLVTIILRSAMSCSCKKNIFLFLTKAYVVGTQKNHLNEMVLLSTKNIC